MPKTTFVGEWVQGGAFLRLRARSAAPVPTCPTYIDQFSIKIFLHFSISPSPTSPPSTPSTCVKSLQPCFSRTPARPLDRGADSTHLGDAHSWRSVMYTPVGRGSNGHFWRNLSGVYRKKTPTKENSVNLLVAPEGLLVFPTSFPHALLRDPPTEQLS